MGKSIAILFLTLINFGCGYFFMSENQVSSNNNTNGITKSEVKKIEEINSNESNRVEPVAKKYIGCWAGSKGGKLEITQNKIYDLGSKEQASYRILSNEGESEVRETTEKYLLETSDKFERSFLSKYITLKFKLNDLVFMFAYDSYEDYTLNKFSGAGTFEKVPCKKRT